MQKISNKINIEHDFKAILECKYLNNNNNKNNNWFSCAINIFKFNQTYQTHQTHQINNSTNSNNWSFILKNMTGIKKLELIGSDVDSIDLNLLLPESFREIHNKLLIDILINGSNSKYWNNFLSGKMSRSVDIINPINKKVNSVKLSISINKYNKYNKSYVLFDVIMTDTTIVNGIINKTGLLTHDLRSIIKSTLNTVNEISKTDSNKNQLITVNELLNEALNLCINSRTTFLPQNFAKKSGIDDLKKIYLECPKIIHKLKHIYPSIIINYYIDTNLKISNNKIDALWHMILNIIKNSVNAKATHVMLKITDNVDIKKENNKEQHKIIIKIIDNGKGMSKEKTKHFLSRKLPETSVVNDVNANRGEGFILSFEQWKINGGVVESVESIESVELVELVKSVESVELVESIKQQNYGTTFVLSIDGSNNLDENDCILSKNQLNYLSNISNDSNKKIILIIDDLLLNVKILCFKLGKCIDTNFAFNNFPILTKDEWQNYNMINIEINEFVFLLAPNGECGKEIALSLIKQCYIIITDIQMPKLNGIDMIKSLIENGITSKIYINSSIVDKDNEEITDLIINNQITYIEKGCNINFNDILNKK